MTAQGTKRWVVDTSAICQIIPWAQRNIHLLQRELQEMDEYFPYFFLTLASSDDLFAGQIFCRRCGDLISFNQGIRCVACNITYSGFADPLLGYIGQIPSLAGTITHGNLGERGARVHGRPILHRIQARLIDGRSSANRDRILKYFLTIGPANGTRQVFLAPQVLSFFPDNWPRDAPIILVHRDYFDQVLYAGSELSHTDFHAYDHTGNWLKLCTYGSWHTVTMRYSLQQRIVSKIIIDMMIADLLAVDRLTRVVRDLGTSIHDVYNWIGKRGSSQRFAQEYERYVHMD